MLSGTKKIKAGHPSRAIKITPRATWGRANKKTVKLTLEAGDGYAVGATGKVKVKPPVP